MMDREARALLALRLVLAVVFLAAGAAKLAAVEFEVQGFAHFGYAPWFMYAIGSLELVGGILLLRSGSAAIGALLMLPVMVGAAASHLKAGDGFAMALPAAVLLALLALVAWRHRPSLRSLLPANRNLAAS